MRPKKTRWVTCEPGERCFRPQCQPRNGLEGVILSLDEFEAMRLAYLEGYDQKKTAKQMKIHQSTISRILNSALLKVTDALVNIKAIKVEGGCCQVIKRENK
jgi:uncharacterized protein